MVFWLVIKYNEQPNIEQIYNFGWIYIAIYSQNKNKCVYLADNKILYAAKTILWQKGRLQEELKKSEYWIKPFILQIPNLLPYMVVAGLVKLF